MTKRADLRPRVAIEAILTHYGAQHVPSGTGWRSMKCPFHDDARASAQVNHITRRFRCFTCDIYGDGIDLVMDREGVPFGQAKQLATKIAGEGSEQLRDAPDASGYLPRQSRHSNGNGDTLPLWGGD